MGLLPLLLDIWFQLPITVSSTTPKLNNVKKQNNKKAQILWVRNMDRAQRKGLFLLQDVLGPQLGGLKQLGVTSHAWGRIWRRLYSQVLLQNWLEVWVHLGVSCGAPTHMAFLTWWSQGGKSAFWHTLRAPREGVFPNEEKTASKAFFDLVSEVKKSYSIIL